MKILKHRRFFSLEPLKLVLLEIPSPQRGEVGGWVMYVAEGAYLAALPPGCGRGFYKLPLPRRFNLQKGSKFGFFCITYSHLGEHSGKYYNILSRAVFKEIIGLRL